MKTKIVMMLGLSLISMASYSQEVVEISVNVNHIIIDNGAARGPQVSVVSVCKITDQFESVDVRAQEIQNSIPKKLNQTCKFNYLGKPEELVAYAGGGIYTAGSQENLVDQYTYAASLASERIKSQVWSVSSTPLNDDLTLVYDTNVVIDPNNKQKSESLRIFFKFKRK